MKLPHKCMSMGRSQSGQALVEFTLVGFIVRFLLFGMIDSCRLISTDQVVINLSRQGANLASRGSVSTSTDAAISNAIAGVIAEASPLNINSSGEIIILAVFNTGQSYVISNQISEGYLTVPSKIGYFIVRASQILTTQSPNATTDRSSAASKPPMGARGAALRRGTTPHGRAPPRRS